MVKSKKKTSRGTLYKRTCAYCGETVKYYHSEKPKYCPYCGSYNYIKPKTETKLFLLQKEYFESGRDKDVLGKMYLILREYANSFIKTHLKNYQLNQYNYDDIDIKASDAATFLIEYYLTKPSFKIEQSFGGYLDNKVKQALFNRKDKKEGEHTSYNSLVDNSNEFGKTELGDLQEKLKFKYIFGDEAEYRRRVLSEKELIEGVHKIIDTIVSTIQTNFGSRDSILLLVGVCARLRKDNSSNFMDLFYKNFGSDYKNFIDESLLFLYEFVKESQIYRENY